MNTEIKVWHDAHQVSSRECCIGNQYYAPNIIPPSQKDSSWDFISSGQTAMK